MFHFTIIATGFKYCHFKNCLWLQFSWSDYIKICHKKMSKRLKGVEKVQKTNILNYFQKDAGLSNQAQAYLQAKQANQNEDISKTPPTTNLSCNCKIKVRSRCRPNCWLLLICIMYQYLHLIWFLAGQTVSREN